MRYSAAGHPAMLLLRDGSVIPVEENGLILAAFDSRHTPMRGCRCRRAIDCCCIPTE
jgi:hypothetical protein